MPRRIFEMFLSLYILVSCISRSICDIDSELGFNLLIKLSYDDHILNEISFQIS